MLDTKQNVLQLLENHTVGTLATISDGKPYSRFMLFFHDELTLYALSNQHAHKVEDLKSNPAVHILLGLDAKSYNQPYCEYEAQASIENSPELRERFWDDSLKEWMSGPSDPNYVLLKFHPTRIRYFAKASENPQELPL